MQQSLGIQTEALGERYQGLPTAVETASNGVFEFISGRVRGLVNGWAEKSSSCAGREILLESVAQAVPT